MSTPPASSPSSGVTGSPPSLPVMPLAPKNGGLALNSKGEWDVWTGGMPKSDWTGLDDSAMKTYESPNQLRSSYASSAQKGYNHHKGGLSAKFGHGDDLALFQDNVMEHLKDTGMDTISYMLDPEDPDKMISVVLGHSRFSPFPRSGAIRVCKCHSMTIMTT